MVQLRLFSTAASLFSQGFASAELQLVLPVAFISWHGTKAYLSTRLSTSDVLLALNKTKENQKGSHTYPSLTFSFCAFPVLSCQLLHCLNIFYRLKRINGSFCLLSCSTVALILHFVLSKNTSVWQGKTEINLGNWCMKMNTRKKLKD